MASSLRTDEEITRIYHRHVDMVYRICFSYMKNQTDTEDLVQETFLKLMTCKKQFESERHEKAWLIITASNACKDALRHWSRKTKSMEESDLPAEPEEKAEDTGVLEAVLALPDKYKTPVYLYYYEEYSTAEIAQILHCPQSTVRNWLSRAQKLLKDKIERR